MAGIPLLRRQGETAESVQLGEEKVSELSNCGLPVPEESLKERWRDFFQEHGVTGQGGNGLKMK